jgi:hypothetical protein
LGWRRAKLRQLFYLNGEEFERSQEERRRPQKPPVSITLRINFELSYLSN